MAAIRVDDKDIVYKYRHRSLCQGLAELTTIAMSKLRSEATRIVTVPATSAGAGSAIKRKTANILAISAVKQL